MVKGINFPTTKAHINNNSSLAKLMSHSHSQPTIFLVFYNFCVCLVFVYLESMMSCRVFQVD